MRVVYLDGRETVLRMLPVDRLEFERQYKQVWLAEPRFEEHFLWMAWTASRREGLTSADFDVWVATVEDWFLSDTAEEESADDDAAGPSPDGMSTDLAASTG